MKKCLLVLWAVGLMPLLVSAELYNIQLNGHEANTYSGAAYVGGAGDVWNNPDWTGVNGGTSTTLFSGLTVLDSTGADNGVTASMTADYNNNTGTWNSGVFNRYSGQSGGSATSGLVDLLVKSDYDSVVNNHYLSLTGLPANTAVTVYVYGSGNGDGQGASWSLDAANGGGSATTVTDLTAAPTGRDVTLASSQGYGWNSIAGTTDGSGNLAITATAGPGSVWWQTYLNGVQVDVVPEPATISMIAILGGSILFIRRRFMM